MEKKNRRQFLKEMGMTAAAAGLISLPAVLANSCAEQTTAIGKKPNILWLSCEDISPHLGCYGYPNAKTPNLDKMAGEGILYTNAFTVAGVCAPNRSSIITGMYASTLGIQNMRSGGEGVQGSSKPELPDKIKCFAELLRNAGYYCTNNSKEDYNFVTPETVWDESSNSAHWKNRADDQPFFAVFNYTGTHEGSIRLNEENRKERTKRLTEDQRQDRSKLELPPYYPDTEITREYWARYFELITAMDYWIADHLDALERAGLSENTIVFFWSDHGAGMPRAKRWLYDSGTHVPLIVKIPAGWQTELKTGSGIRDEQLVSSIDFAPTVLNLAGLNIPANMQGRPFLGPDLAEKCEFVYGIRDRMDERYDTIRSVRNKRYRYLINYRSFKPYYQYMQSAERGPVMQEIRRLQKAGNLPEEVALFTKPGKPVEELYDLQNDPHEVNNMAGNSELSAILEKFRNEHVKWMLRTRDTGLIPEAELVNLAEKAGNRYAVLQQPDAEAFLLKLQKAALMAGKPEPEDVNELKNFLEDSSPSVRYWALTGFGNLKEISNSLSGTIQPFLKDDSAIVRVAAARAMIKTGNIDAALQVLKNELQSDAEWVRLSAAIVLDEIGEKARPLIPQLQAALDDQYNKYVVRVANRALNELMGTDNRVR